VQCSNGNDYCRDRSCQFCSRGRFCGVHSQKIDINTSAELANVNARMSEKRGAVHATDRPARRDERRIVTANLKGTQLLKA
jgi:hypothetical protein